MKGSVRIRLARLGRKHQPVFNIVVTQARKAQQKLPIEVLGVYNSVAEPLSPQDKADGKIPTKDVQLDFLRSQYWLGVGAQPTPTVARLFKKAGLLPPGWPGPNKSGKQPSETPKVVAPREAADEPAPPPVR